jgi:hypothetical protein
MYIKKIESYDFINFMAYIVAFINSFNVLFSLLCFEKEENVIKNLY